jgi:hypothetical protein
MKWEEELWAELDAMPQTEQIIQAGGWITHITQRLLPELGRRRRQVVLEVLAAPDWDATRLAEEIGARRSTITRLAEEGRAAAREDRKRDEALAAAEAPEEVAS